MEQDQDTAYQDPYWIKDKYNLAKYVPVSMRDDPTVSRLVKSFSIAKFPHHLIRKIKKRVLELKGRVVLAYEHIGSWAIARNHYPRGWYSDKDLREIGEYCIRHFCEHYDLSVSDETLKIVSIHGAYQFKPPKNPQEMFYLSPEWRDVRRKLMRLYPLQCMKCGSKSRVQADHIRPRSLWPHLALHLDNCQLLCEDCNSRKSNTSSTDYRSYYQKERCRRFMSEPVVEGVAEVIEDDPPFEPGVFWFGQPINNLASPTRIQV